MDTRIRTIRIHTCIIPTITTIIMVHQMVLVGYHQDWWWTITWPWMETMEWLDIIPKNRRKSSASGDLWTLLWFGPRWNGNGWQMKILICIMRTWAKCWVSVELLFTLSYPHKLASCSNLTKQANLRLQAGLWKGVYLMGQSNTTSLKFTIYVHR